MAARVKVQQRQAKLFAALHFIKKGIAGFFQRIFNRMTEVNQIAVVGRICPEDSDFSQAALKSSMISVVSGAARH
jgi:hypothetical protein